MKAGSTGYLKIELAGLNLNVVSEVVFTIKARGGSVSKVYPDDVELSNGKFLVPLDQHETTTLCGWSKVEAQINYSDNSVSKTETFDLLIKDTIATKYLDENEPSDDDVEISLAVETVQIVSSGSGSGGTTVDAYTKTETNTLLAAKADKTTVYTKTETDTALALKADKSSTYTKTEVDTALTTKANASDVYTKAQADAKFALIGETVTDEQIAEAVEAYLTENPISSDSYKFVDNINVDYAFDSDTNANYTIVRVYKTKLDGTKQFPFVFAPNGENAGEYSTYDMNAEYGFELAINAGVFNTSTLKPDGLLIQNGTLYQNSPSSSHSNCKPLIIDNNGDLSSADYNADGNTLISSGAFSAVCGFMPIIVDYAKVPQSSWNNISHYTQNAQRQIIGQFGNGDYAILTCEGRNYQNSDGWTVAEAQNICVKHGIKFAYLLDGGGSTELMIGKKHFNTIYEGTTGRVVPTFIVFNGTNTISSQIMPTAPTIPTVQPKTLTSISATKTDVNYDVGDELTDDDITVTAYYSDGTNGVVSGWTSNIQSIDMSTSGSKSLIISYTEDGVTKNATVTINVTATSSSDEPITLTQTIGVANGKSITVSSTSTNKGVKFTSTSTRGTAYATSGDINLEGDYYMIEVPSNASKVKVTCPNLIAGIGLWGEGTKTTSERLVDTGWGEVDGTEYQFEPSTYKYFSCNFKNQSNTALGNYDTTQISIEFYE